VFGVFLGFFTLNVIGNFPGPPPLSGFQKTGSAVSQNSSGVCEADGFGFLGVQIPDGKQTQAEVQNANLQGQEIIEEIDIPGSEETQGANLQGADLSNANLLGVYLLWANLKQANLRGANLMGTYLSWANLAGANLQGADIRGANLQGANLEKANLQQANLKKANLQGANLLWANLQGANLVDTNLEGTMLSWVNVRGAQYCKTTQFPKDFNPAQHGMVLVEPETK
jgi:uncharacterized protein YjbI with pentapeptide repeats